MLPAEDWANVRPLEQLGFNNLLTNFDRKHSTVSLIGMPGAGKSTVGIILAKLCGMRFVDTDVDIQITADATLQEILDARGHLYLRELEERVVMGVDIDHAVISTGGSVVYSSKIMARLAQAGPIVYLEAAAEVLAHRIAAAPARGIACEPGTSFEAICAERKPLYERYADLRIRADEGSADEVAAEVQNKVYALPHREP